MAAVIKADTRTDQNANVFNLDDLNNRVSEFRYQVQHSSPTGSDSQLQTLLAALDSALQSIEQVKEASLKNWQHSAVHLAVAIAERVIRRQLTSTPEIPVELVREALELAAGDNHVKIHLNPHDYATLADQVASVASQMNQLSPTDIIADPEVTPGGCVVKTEFGEIDQRFESQLARIESELV